MLTSEQSQAIYDHAVKCSIEDLEHPESETAIRVIKLAAAAVVYALNEYERQKEKA